MTKLDVLGRGWGFGGVGNLGRGSLLKSVLTSQSPPPNSETSRKFLTAVKRGTERRAAGTGGAGYGRGRGRGGGGGGPQSAEAAAGT